MQLGSRPISGRRAAGRAAVNQLDLFSGGDAPPAASQVTALEKERAGKRVSASLTIEASGLKCAVSIPNATTKARQARPRRSNSQATRIVAREDLPEYSAPDQELVDRTIASLPAGRMWFTYAAIRECFGISRATVARKVKEGLVPGIRFRGKSVLEDGPVRRFDRSQLRWLLLAVRSRR